MFIWTGGIPGVGKTTIVNAAIKRNRWSNHIQLLKTSGVLLRLAGLSDPKDIFQLEQSQRRELGMMVHKTILEEDINEPGVIKIEDGHFSIYIPESNECRVVLPDDGLTSSRTIALVLFEALPEHILEHILRDNRRDERLRRYGVLMGNQIPEIISKIEKYLSMERTVAQILSLKMEVPLITVTNDGDIEAAIEVFMSGIEGLMRTSKEREYMSHRIEKE